jgi:2-amino-4-hydroxy-6-hydroxymethyldihydropteridine diphosphokinase
MSKQVVSYLGLGANLGNPIRQLQQALVLLHHSQGISISQVSSLYETSPVGYLDQPNFYNLVVEIDTTLSPTQLLSKTQKVEQRLHRVRKERFGPRTIDVDILLYEQRVVQLPDLIIPHPRLAERAFVLIPLRELTGNIVLPSGTQLDSTMAQLPKDQWIQKRSFSWKDEK